MKGLLLNNYYAVRDNIRLFLGLDAALALALLLVGSPLLLNIFVLITPPGLALLASSAPVREAAGQWSKYKLTLAVSRKQIVRSLFLSHLAWCALGLLLAALVMALALSLHGNIYFAYGWRDALTLLLCGLVAAVLIGAVAYPLLNLWGGERGEAVLLLSLAGAAAFICGLSLLINLISGPGPVSDLEYYLSLSLILLLAAGAFALSRRLSLLLFLRREW